MLSLDCQLYIALRMIATRLSVVFTEIGRFKGGLDKSYGWFIYRNLFVLTM